MSQTLTGIVGIGGAAGQKMHLPVLRQMKDVKVVDGFDVVSNFPGYEGLKGDGIRLFFETTDEYLRTSEAKIIHICTPSGWHASNAIAAAKAGKAVIIEKPIGIDLESIDKLIETRDKTRMWMSGWFQNRSSNHMALLHQAISHGHLGDIEIIKMSTPWFRPKSYFFSDKACTQRNWKGTYLKKDGGLLADGGGALMNQAIHYVDFVTWLLDAAGQRVMAVEGGVAQQILHPYIEAEDTAYAKLIIGRDKKVLGHGSIEAHTTQYCGKDRERPQTLEIIGTKGYVYVEDGEVISARLNGRKSQEYFGRTSGAGGGGTDPANISLPIHLAHMKEAYEAFRTGKAPPVSLESARKSVELILAAYLSAKKGGKNVTLPLNKPYFIPDATVIQDKLV